MPYRKFQFKNKINTKFTEELEDSRSATDIELADEDYKILNALKNEKELVKQFCKDYENQLNLFRMMDDKLSYFTDYTNKKFLLYSKNGAIYKPSCDKVFKISNIAKSNSCYYDTPIFAFYKSRQISAFLTSNGIIRDS
jgi:hypothetical protein